MRRDQVEDTVDVHIAEGQRYHADVDGQGWLRLEGAVAIAEEDRDLGTSGNRGNVDYSVVVLVVDLHAV